MVNNAGFGLYGPVEDIGIDEARYQFEVNVSGPARLTQLLLPAMRKKGAGTIVNITSMAGKIYTLLGAWYHATKHALEGWSDSLRLELAPFGIRVVVVEPGLIETGFGDVVADGLFKRSGEGPYAKVTQAVAKSTRELVQHWHRSRFEAAVHSLKRGRRLGARSRAPTSPAPLVAVMFTFWAKRIA